MNPVSITYRFQPAARLFATSLAILGLMTLPVVANAASARPTTSAVMRFQASDKPAFKFKTSASVQKGLALLKTFGLPETALSDLCPILGDKTLLTKVLKALASPMLTDAQITDFVTQAHALATDPNDPLTRVALTAYVAQGMVTTAANKKIPAADAAKLALIGGKSGEKKPTLKDIQAALKVAEPTLSDADINELLFWYALGYDQLSYQAFEFFIVEAELAYYDVPADQITAILEHFDDQAATDNALAALSLPADELKALIGGYDKEVELLGKNYNRKGAATTSAEEADAILRAQIANGPDTALMVVPSVMPNQADQPPPPTPDLTAAMAQIQADAAAATKGAALPKIVEQDLSKGNTAAAERLMKEAGLTPDQIKKVEAKDAACKIAAGSDYEKIMTEVIASIIIDETTIVQAITAKQAYTLTEPQAADQVAK